MGKVYSAIPVTGLRPLALALPLLALAGCSFWEAEETPLEGDRIAVLTYDRSLRADTSLAGQTPQLPSAVANDTWPQAGATPNHAPQHVALPGALSQVWRAGIGDGNSESGRILSQPVVIDGRVYALDAGSRVTAVEAGSGRQVWSEELGDGESFGGGLAHDGENLYATTGTGTVYALNPDNGEVIWERRLGAPLRGAPSVAGGGVLMIDVLNRLHVLDAVDGETIWTHQGIEEVAGLLGAASPAIGEGAVIAAYSSGEIYALVAEGGQEVWADSLAALTRVDPIADLADIRGNPVLAEGTVYATGNANRTVAIDLRSGTRIWEVELGGAQTPWVSGQAVYAIGSDGQLVAIERDGGRIYWVTQLARYEEPEDRSGPISWYGPVLAGGRLLLASSAGELLSVDPATGEITDTRELPEGATASPVVAGGTLYLMMDDGDLLALR